MKKRKEAYKHKIAEVGLITMCYLISYYESDGIEDYIECNIILEAIKEFCEFNGIKGYPTRYDSKLLNSYKGEEFDIKQKASEVVKFIEKSCS